MTREQTKNYSPPQLPLIGIWVGSALIAFGSSEATVGTWYPELDSIAIYIHGFSAAFLFFRAGTP